MKALACLVVMSLALPAGAQAPADAPCKPGDVVLAPEVAVATAKRLVEAEAKVKVYEANPPLPAWAVVLLVVAGAAVGGGAVVIAYEAGKPKP